jgi:carbonic anhydrase/acetyltransferase-like protein (isoleucine patch superfamily)
MAVIPYDGKAPRIAPSVFLADGTVVAGDVEIGEDSSVWFGTVIRGDVNTVRIGARTNVQDQSMVHVTGGTHPTVIGDDVTVGHRAVLHGCTIHDRCLVGIGAIVLDGAVVGPDAMVGAGALVPPGMVVPPGKLVLGAPAKVKRDLTPDEIAFFRTSAARYAGYAAKYRREREGGPR